MEKVSKKEVEEKCGELQGALIENIELDKQMIDLKVRQAKAQKRLSLARDAVHFIRIN